MIPWGSYAGSITTASPVVLSPMRYMKFIICRATWSSVPTSLPDRSWRKYNCCSDIGKNFRRVMDDFSVSQ